MQTASKGMVGNVTVLVTNGRTKTPEEWAEEISNKVLYIADTAPEPIRVQAMQFRAQMYRVIRDNIAFAIEQEKQWLQQQMLKR